MSYEFSFPYIWGATPDLFQGLWMTLLVSLVSIAISVVLGTVCACLRLFKVPVLSQIATAYVHFMRSTPLLVQLYFIFYGLASLGLGLGGFWSGVLALSLWGGAYNTENVRGGLAAVPKGLQEAALSLGLRPALYLRLVALPIGLRVCIPAMLNTSVSVLKNSSYLQAIGVAELTFVAMNRVAMDFRTLEMFLAIGLIYLTIVLLLSAAVRRLEAVLQAPFRTA
ncbi:amino acid ABC transporter membrane protein 1 (PAAT family) [Roseovarius halotolerans]|uniref:Glutamine transport system permease protein GlnP n=1 Tax=Roseovarius halotolerans TaxID=505353 RepID=A0A1X6ZI95_9RHOB|nr:amino acid ABC transporter permease [Roseovarius halotolerans]RKT30995.1 amino acid ABC transporter membrane protein 1 (PAAT family) [Roseovarius halotolerans]SLN52104.1 Glutamine transport system permease protein GlnP [Roseovarius halotolerans]